MSTIKVLVNDLWGNAQIRRQFIVTAIGGAFLEVVLASIWGGLAFLSMGIDVSTVLGKVAAILIIVSDFVLIPVLALSPLLRIGFIVHRLLGDAKLTVLSMGVMFLSLLVGFLLLSCLVGGFLRILLLKPGYWD